MTCFYLCVVCEKMYILILRDKICHVFLTKCNLFMNGKGTNYKFNMHIVCIMNCNILAYVYMLSSIVMDINLLTLLSWVMVKDYFTVLFFRACCLIVDRSKDNLHT